MHTPQDYSALLVLVRDKLEDDGEPRVRTNYTFLFIDRVIRYVISGNVSLWSGVEENAYFDIIERAQIEAILDVMAEVWPEAIRSERAETLIRIIDRLEHQREYFNPAADSRADYLERKLRVQRS